MRAPCTMEKLLNVCRRSGVIVLTYAVSTVLVICWLIFTIQITLQENQEVAEGVDTIGRTTEFIKVAISLTDLHHPLLSCCDGVKEQHCLVIAPQLHC